MQCDRSLCAPRSRLILWHSVCFIGAAFLAMVWFGAARAAEDVRPAASPAAPPAAAPAVPRDAANPPARPGPPGKRAPAPPDSAALEADLLRAYLPKADLGVDRFLAAHPDADGRGVIVAILDTGVDLRQPGLLTTPTGDRKILDVYDATDNGLVELSTVRKTADSTLAGMTGRTLRLGAHRADDGLYRLGLLRGAELFPGGLEDRILSDRRIERERLIANWENQVAEGPRDRHEAEKDSTAPPDRERTYKELRREADRDFQDPGPAYDLVAFKKSGAWTLVVDVNGDGKLRDDIELLPYGKRADVAVFPPPASLSIALSTIAGDGSSASLFFDQGGHGTHVAGIVGAYYGPDDPLNGLAPGVRFLAIKIGNGRFGGSTSHNSMAKGLDWAIRHGAMVANASFGGTSWFENGQEITSKFFDQMVQDHGIFISVSAGNEGPGLSTVGSPGTARRAFTMGAAISPWTMLASYGGLTAEPGLLPKRNAPATEGIRLFPFSSRGPLANGSPGVDFVSPGAALSTLPTWLLTRNENWNGTSMAAPQAAGCLALLLSACMQEGVPVSPPRMDRAMRAAAAPLKGAGIPWALA